MIAVGPDRKTQVEFAAAQPVALVTRFVLTREHANAVAQPTGPVVLAGAL
jgi:anti-sigma-K factor RskA